MSVDLSKLQLFSETSSNKTIYFGGGSITVPNLPGTGETNTTLTIPHNYSSDNLLYQVSVQVTGGDLLILPFQSNDGRFFAYASIDSTNLYVTINTNDSGGGGFPGGTYVVSATIFVP